MGGKDLLQVWGRPSARLQACRFWLETCARSVVLMHCRARAAHLGTTIAWGQVVWGLVCVLLWEASCAARKHGTLQLQSSEQLTISFTNLCTCPTGQDGAGTRRTINLASEACLQATDDSDVCGRIVSCHFGWMAFGLDSAAQVTQALLDILAASWPYEGIVSVGACILHAC
eukprot:1656316-Amphidinium_carterae.1